MNYSQFIIDSCTGRIQMVIQGIHQVSNKYLNILSLRDLSRPFITIFLTFSFITVDATKYIYRLLLTCSTINIGRRGERKLRYNHRYQRTLQHDVFHYHVRSKMSINVKYTFQEKTNSRRRSKTFSVSTSISKADTRYSGMKKVLYDL